MRRTVDQQRPLVAIPAPHEHARELRGIATVLEALPQAAELVLQALVARGIDPTRGREGMSGEQVLRAMIAKQMNCWSYRELAFHLSDSTVYRAFCGIGVGEPGPSRSALQHNIKAVPAEVMERINRMLVLHAEAVRVEDGQRVRTDSTVIEAAIQSPTDSRLLWDCVRVLVRLLRRAQGYVTVHFTNHCRVAKRRALQIRHAARMELRMQPYQDLLKVTAKTVQTAQQVVLRLQKETRRGRRQKARLLAEEIARYAELARRVMNQTRQRIFLGQAVASTQKVVSIFEPHTDIIVKDQRETLYGHKVFLTTGASGLVLDLLLPPGNPSDATFAVSAVQRQKELYGRAPRQVCFDGGFTSNANLASLKELGVIDVVFCKAKGIAITAMAKSAWVYRKLRHFRAGIEAGISFLKRCFGWDCCTWRGWTSFQSYAWASVVAANALLLARHLMT
jgi:IS5 family transposase